ncbi:MAG: hypothetical protein ACI9IP_002834 [Arcticibacterium sp.]|jgi:hypothetical protein
MINYYEERIRNEQKEFETLQKKNNVTSNLRLAAIIVSAILLYFLFKTSVLFTFLSIFLILAGFYFLVRYHEKVQDELDLKKVLLDVLKNEVNILEGKGNTYSSGEQFINDKHDFASDLDVFGGFSLFHMLNRGRTKAGQAKLADSLLASPIKSEIEALQKANIELRNKAIWGQNFQASLFELSGAPIEGLIGLENPPKIKFEGLIKYYAFLKWVLAIGVIAVFYYYGVGVGVTTLFGLVAFNYSLVGVNRKVTEPYFNKIKGLNRDLGKFKTAIDWILKEEWRSDYLSRAYKLLPTDGKNPIEAFQLISKKIDMKNNQFAAFFLYAFSPFDLVQLVYLRKWVNENPGFFQKIFGVIADFEQVTSLATLSFNQPKWAIPEFAENSGVRISGEGLGHALKPDSVCNDFDLNTNNRLTLITGSNMSGKSTFLRTLGTNVILAYAGSCVFARSLSLNTGIQLFAYMRIKDSLEQDSSTFKAEIDRIKILLEAMDNVPKSLLLVDEMLRGTNSEDKLKGSLAFLERVIKSDAFALVATHDLRMTDMAKTYPEHSKNYYFEYDAEDGELIFDYKMKPGICHSFNASELLRSVGLDV